MKITHFFNQQNKISKQAQDEASFLLTNKLGGYLWLADKPTSRYQGWFFTPSNLLGKQIFKIVENIEVLDQGPVTELKNSFWSTSRKRNRLEESFFLPAFQDALVFQTSKKVDLAVTLDVKPSYQNQEQGRHYQLTKTGDDWLVGFSQEGIDLPFIFLAVKSDAQKSRLLNQWLCRYYSFDEQRKSPPFHRYVFKALSFEKAGLVVLAVAGSAQEALKQANFVWQRLNGLKKEKQQELKKIKPLNIKNKETRLACVSSQFALSQFLCFDKKSRQVKGIYGGLPWFFQFWPRDELISLKALFLLEPKNGRAILTKLINLAKKDGPNQTADFLGLLSKRIDDVLKTSQLNWRTTKKARKFLNKTGNDYFTDNLSQGLVLHPSKTTWMDTIERGPAALEIQALALNWLKALSRCGFYQKDGYQQTAKIWPLLLKQRFWNGRVLADSFNLAEKRADFTIRVNPFLAAYFSPDLLCFREWLCCFDNVLQEVWLNWGGLSTLSQKNPLFQKSHTGENSLSYHQGDSWFFINNLSALIMQRINSRHFSPYIKQILRASSQEILWQGIIGYHAELSSAEKLISRGCLAQAWSSAAFLELCFELFKPS